MICGTDVFRHEISVVAVDERSCCFENCGNHLGCNSSWLKRLYHDEILLNYSICSVV